jgi:hypothetical protein
MGWLGVLAKCNAMLSIVHESFRFKIMLNIPSSSFLGSWMIRFKIMLSMVQVS